MYINSVKAALPKTRDSLMTFFAKHVPQPQAPQSIVQYNIIIPNSNDSVLAIFAYLPKENFWTEVVSFRYLKRRWPEVTKVVRTIAGQDTVTVFYRFTSLKDNSIDTALKSVRVRTTKKDKTPLRWKEVRNEVTDNL